MLKTIIISVEIQTERKLCNIVKSEGLLSRVIF